MDLTGKQNYKDTLKVNMLLTLAIWCVLCGISMLLMLMVAADKTIVIADAAQEQKELSGVHGRADDVESAVLSVQSDQSVPNQLRIPLEKGTKAEQVTVENKYVAQELWIYVTDAEEAFYRQNAISGDVTPITECRYELQEDGVLLKIKMNAVLEYHSTMEDGSLKIAFSNPRDNYKQIVVIDAIGGGSETGLRSGLLTEKEIALQVARLVQKKVEQAEIKIYLTRNEDVDVTMEQRVGFVQAVDADLFIQIRVAENSEDVGQYGIQAYYNDEYYIPVFGNVELADAVTKKVTIAASNRALGLFPAEENSILMQLDMPAAAISLGYLTNAEESRLLSQTSYQEKLAAGIAEAILEVYTNEYAQ